MRNTKKQLEKIFIDYRSPLYIKAHNFLALITLVSVMFIALETVQSLQPYSEIFRIVEWVTVAIFTVEYIGYLITKKKKPQYVFSFYGMVDLVAILPTYFGLANFSFLKIARIARILRFLRMMRLVKMLRMKKGEKHTDATKAVQRISIQIYVLTLVLSVLIFGALIYLIEGNNPVFANIPLGMLWALKLTLGGVSQAIPQTVWGEIISVGARFVGLLLFGLLIHIVGKYFERMLLGSKSVE